METVDRILADSVSGASEIEEMLLEALREAPEEELVPLVEALPGRLESAFPQMANLLELAKDIARLEPGADPARSLRELAGRRLDEKRTGDERLSHVVEPLLPPGDLLVFTLSKSGTVAAVVEDLARGERRINVLVAESRPGAEGARMARDLAEHGIRARTCDDFLLLSLVPPEAAPRRPPGYVGKPVVLVGADAVHPDALVNKVGTRALLDTARRAGVPAFVLASSSKLRTETAPRALGSLFETIPRAEIVVLTEKGQLDG